MGIRTVGIPRVPWVPTGMGVTVIISWNGNGNKSMGMEIELWEWNEFLVHFSTYHMRFCSIIRKTGKARPC